ncbi:SprT family protein [Peribacillus alkalitolerans]|uniref:SprT family protein n=1 Tax=Peribacillus alkalitolerans TaxID=1550385 RepID=UPI0013D5E733|nr:SprT family protein [Peribacillus alkalitolerans]
MNNQQLQRMTEEISISLFHKPFLHSVYFNARLKTTGGRYLLQSHNIEINERYLKEYGVEEIIGIIKHELCHYHLHIEGRGYQHKDQDFKELMKKVGAPRFCTPLKHYFRENITSKKLYIYECTGCTQKYRRKKRVNIDRYVCGKCKGRLKLVKTTDSST